MKYYKFNDGSVAVTSAMWFACNNQKTIAFICWDASIEYFIEYAASLRVFAFLLTFQMDEVEKLKSLTDLHPHCLFVYPTNIANVRIFDCALAQNCILCNTEQMSIPALRKDAVQFLQKGGMMINYSAANADILRAECTDSKPMLLLPYICQDREREFLATLLRQSDKLYDFAAVFNLTARRRVIVDALTARGLKICVIQNCFGVERDRKIAQCKALLNIHAHDLYKVYESIRCNRWLAAGMTVVSESCIDKEIYVAPNGGQMHFVDAEKLIDFCLHFVSGFSFPTQAEQSIVAQENVELEKQSLGNINRWLGDAYLPRPNTELGIQYIYGAGNFLQNVTASALTAFATDGNNNLYIDANVSFNRLFGDPCVGVEKHLYILFAEIRICLPEIRQCNYAIRQERDGLVLLQK